MSGRLPREGSKVRLIGLKNPDLNGKVGSITSYSRDGERVMISLRDGPQGLVKVKPKQMEVLEEATGNGHGGRGRPDMHRQQSSRSTRDHSRDHYSSSQRGLDRGGSQRGGGMNRAGSANSFRENASVGGASNVSQEVMETLRSADAMFDLADTSGDGLISQEEFEYYMKKHTNHDNKMIRECFFMIDKDGNGDITRDEVRAAFLKKRRELKGGGDDTSSKKNFEEEMLEVSRDADRLFERADADGNGVLSKREFEVYMKKYTNHTDAAIHELFDSMDVDRDGYITREEVRKVYMEKKNGGEKVTLKDLLGLGDDDVAEIEDDVYNMFFLSDACSQSFWFAILVWLLKLGLIIIIAIDLFTTYSFPPSSEVPFLVKMAQFLLLPVNVSVQEELITTFFIYANLKWSKTILELNPGASKCKFHMANTMRFLDGVSFLFINTTLLLQATNVLGAFLNFAALQFLSSIDNVALHLARNGYLTESLEEVAKDVLLMSLPRNHNDCMQVMDSFMFVLLNIVMVAAWSVKTIMF